MDPHGQPKVPTIVPLLQNIPFQQCQKLAGSMSLCPWAAWYSSAGKAMPAFAARARGAEGDVGESSYFCLRSHGCCVL